MALTEAIWPKSNARYDIMRWQFWEGCHWNPTCAKFIVRHLFGNESIDLDAAAIDFGRLARVLDDHLAARPWLVGDAMTTADISVAAILFFREHCRFPMDGFDNIERWMEGIEALPAWQKAGGLPAFSRAS